MSTIKFNIKEEYKELTSWLLDVHENFANIGTVMYEKRNIIKKVEAPNGELFVIKKYKKPHLIQRIVYSFFKKSKASRAYSFAEYLLAKGIATPYPVAFVEVFEGFLLKCCYYVSVYKSGENCMVLDDNNSDVQLIEKLAAFMVRMHDKGFLHGDTNLSNFLYRKKDGEYEIFTLDLNRSRIKVNLGKNDCLSNFMRLSHEIATMEQIVMHYARMRKWDEKQCVNFVKSKIKSLERHEDLRGFLTMKTPAYRQRRKMRNNGIVAP